jgi:hypothetical protein
MMKARIPSPLPPIARIVSPLRPKYLRRIAPRKPLCVCNVRGKGVRYSCDSRHAFDVL